MNHCDLVFHYHDQTKHDYYRYAASLGHLDWDNQPDPFRRFIGSRLISLPFTEVHPALEYDQLYSQRIQAHPVSVETISALFYYSLALSAWKQYQDTSWALRVNPSSGNLHPTEGYLVIDKVTNHAHRTWLEGKPLGGCLRISVSGFLNLGLACRSRAQVGCCP
jgi:hypothetical protein